MNLILMFFAFFTAFLFAADPTGVPPAVVNVTTLVLGVGLSLFLKFGPIPSRVVSVIAFLAGTVATIEPLAIQVLPHSVDVIILSLSFILVATNERLQGRLDSGGK